MRTDSCIYSYAIGVDTAACTGCQACALACSYYNWKSFSLSKAAIQIIRNNADGNIAVNIDETKCNMCETETVPYCIQFCAPGALSITRCRNRTLLAT